MKLSTVHKQRLAKIARVASAGALVVGSVATALPAQAVDAGSLTAHKVTISDSRLGNSGTTYNHEFTPQTSSTTQIVSIGVRYCTTSAGWDDCVAPTGLNVPSDLTGASATGFTGTSPVFSQEASNEFSVEFTPTDEDDPGLQDDPEAIQTKNVIMTGLITNPTSQGTYYAIVRTFNESDNIIDEGVAAFATVTRVQVSGRVAESMSFNVAGVSQNAACGGSENASVTSTATSIPFGNFTSGTPLVACQTVGVGTNAVGGYTVGIRHTLGSNTQYFGGMCRQTATGCSADGAGAGITAANVIADQNLTTTPAAWVVGDGNDSNNTYGVGLNANGGQATGFASGTVFRTMYGANPVTVASSSTATASVPTTVKLKADVPATQTAGVYQNSLEYIVTPTF